jgi:hypothetical protein
MALARIGNASKLIIVKVALLSSIALHCLEQQTRNSQDRRSEEVERLSCKRQCANAPKSSHSTDRDYYTKTTHIVSPLHLSRAQYKASPE